jgi:hypothetical protein
MSNAAESKGRDGGMPDWWEADEETFMRNLTICEEDRRHDPHFAGPWRGGFRWFRSPNVVCIEKVRRARRKREANGTVA